MRSVMCEIRVCTALGYLAAAAVCSEKKIAESHLQTKATYSQPNTAKYRVYSSVGLSGGTCGGLDCARGRLQRQLHGVPTATPALREKHTSAAQQPA